MEYKFWGWEQADVVAVTDQYKGFVHRLIYMMHCQKSGVPRPAHQECGRNGLRKIRRWDSARLQHFWHRTYLAVRCMASCGLVEIIIVIMWLGTVVLI